MKIYEIMARKHTNCIMDALFSLEIDGHIKADQWQDLFDRGETTDVFGRCMSADEAAAALWIDLRKDLESAWIAKITMEQAVAIGNSAGILPNAYIELCPGVKIPASEVPIRWNAEHPDDPKIYRNDENLMP